MSVNPRLRPRALETIKESATSQIYRLCGARPGNLAVIAKRGPSSKLRAERIVYTSVLPGVPVPPLECFGLVDQEEGHSWIFLEDVAGQAFDRHISPHRIAAARWLAALHLSTAAMAPRDDLPTVDVEGQLRDVRQARQAIVEAMPAAHASTEAVVALRHALATLEDIETDWKTVERRSEGLRSTLVHGDLVPKNLRVRTGRIGSTLVALDWSTAGWGMGAVDLGLVDLPSYASIVGRQWPEFTLEKARETACVGKMFRWIAAVHSAGARLGHSVRDTGITLLKDCERGLSVALAELRALP
jgi:aminoglycoside phosphotransferase (APT) family kinase protein